MANRKLFKYMSPEIAKIALSERGATFRCSYPKDFNDPYELFLAIDFNEASDVLAFYQEVVGNLPQLPTTCFSKSPSVTPMWAHYGDNLTGVVVQTEEDCLKKHCKDGNFGDVDYLDAPPDGLSGLVGQAFVTCKPRHTYLLRQAVFSSAYYSKNSCWAYEQERRMICSDDGVAHNGDMMLLQVPSTCISALIVGPRASLDTKECMRDRAKQLGCNYYEMRIGQSTATPYFSDKNGKPYTFNGEELEPSLSFCVKCKEPTSEGQDTCPWCQINDQLREAAAEKNPYRMLHHFGMLENYIDQMNEISSGFHKDDD